MISEAYIAARIGKGMGVIAVDDRRIGFVLGLEGSDMLRITTEPAKGVGYDHLVPLSWVNDVNEYVFLDKPAAYIAINWRKAARRRGMRGAGLKRGLRLPVARQAALAPQGADCQGEPVPEER